MTAEQIPVELPDPEHPHFDPQRGEFVTHDHVHAGPHIHGIRNGRPVVIYDAGSNYSPRRSR